MLNLILNTIIFFNFSGTIIQEKIENSIKIEQNKIIEKKEKKWNKLHIKIPKDGVKSLYYTAYAIGNKDRYKNLLNIVKNTEINSVTIDIKTVTGYTNFDFDNSRFGKIKPISNGTIKNIKEKIKKLHKKGIYVIGRIVVFKDNLLASKRPDLTYKWSYNKKLVWTDYAGNKYLDAGNKEVWDYNAEIASQAYEMGFDEINFDYIRFPSDGKISKIYAPFSKNILAKYGNLGKIRVINKFSKYITDKLRKKYPRIVLSADVFGLVTNGDMKGIGQSLEGFLENFDYVAPMTYPSHYGRGFLGFKNPDNHPYEVIKDSLKNSFFKIERYNLELKKNLINNNSPIIPFHKGDEDKVLKKKQIRLWLQGFTCTWCKGATPYNSYKFKLQIKAIKDMGLNSFFVWNSNSRYYENWYK